MTQEYPPPPPPGYGPPPPGYFPPQPSYPQAPPGWGSPTPYPPFAPPPRKTNALAIASLVCACLPFLIITPVLAVVFGHVSRKQIREQGEGGAGLALAGLIVGYVFGAMVLAAVVIPIAVNRHGGTAGYRVAHQNLSNLAIAEETNRAKQGTYTNSIVTLKDVDGLPVYVDTRTKRASLAAGSNGGAGYCVVAGVPTDNRYYLLDSASSDLSDPVYSSMADAQAACSFGVVWGATYEAQE